MGCKIIFSPQAIADLESAVRFIAKENLGAAVRVGNALIDRVAILENFPFVGSPYPKRVGVRKLVSRPYWKVGHARPAVAEGSTLKEVPF